MKYKFQSHHRFLFQWHCRTFFNLSERLSELERAYLEVCFRLPKSRFEVSETGYPHFSFYTYSHRVRGDKVNSSRFAYGSVENWERAWPAAQEVLKEKGIELPEGLADNRFYGLGWDFEANQFKVYFRTLDWQTVPPDFQALVQGFSTGEHRLEALVSLTYEATNVLERKVYLYPKDDSPDALRLVKMVTDRRGVVEQADTSPTKLLPYKLNASGRKIVELYDEIDLSLDTVAYKDPEDFTLYFP